MKKNKLPTNKEFIEKFVNQLMILIRRGGRVVEGARLESV